MKKQIKSIFCLILLGLFVLPTKVIAVDVNELSDTINKISGNTGSSDSVKMFVMMTVLTLIPALLILTTSFTRIIMVLSFVRSSLGTQLDTLRLHAHAHKVVIYKHDGRIPT